MGSDSDNGNIIDNLAFKIDEHLREIRIGLCTVAILALGYAVKSVKPFTKFSLVQQIPPSFIEKNIKLNGRVVDIKSIPLFISEETHPPILSLSKVILFIDHRPIYSTPFSSRKQVTPLAVSLDSVAVSPAGLATVYEIVRDKDVGFVLLSTQQEDTLNVLSCIVHCKIPGLGAWRRLVSGPCSLSRHLVSRGLASLGEADERLAVRSRLYRQHRAELARAETSAKKARLGLWASEEEIEKTDGKFSLWEIVGRFFNRDIKNRERDEGEEIISHTKNRFSLWELVRRYLRRGKSRWKYK